ENYAEFRHRVGLVLPDDILLGNLTVRRELILAASLRAGSGAARRPRQARVDEVIRQLDLVEPATQRIDTLSTGQRRRTSIALELLPEPWLLALDDPTVGLDPALDGEVMGTLRRLADGGCTVAFATNSVPHLQLCDRVLVLCRGGRVGYFGP